MATNNLLTSWYRSRIGEPTTDDEVRGYWVFVLGLILGIVGIVLFVPSTAGDALRQWAIVVAAAGLALLIAGPLIRLPLREAATWLVYLGLVVCGIAIVWFFTAYPSTWRSQANTLIGLYGAGTLLMAISGVLIPLLIPGREAEHALESEIEELERSVADTEADEADLATKLRSLHTSQARFEHYEDSAGEYRWRLRHRNGNTIADSGEGYTRRHNAQKGMQSVRRNALGAAVLYLESEADLPAETTEFETLEESPSQAEFELYRDEADEFRFRLRHDNGNILADSGEGYRSRTGARTAIDRIREYVAEAVFLRFDPVGFEIYRDKLSEWRWRLVHKNGNILADSGEGYSRRRDARRAIDRLQDSLDEMEIEVYEDASGEHRWRILSGNNRIMADSGQGYADRSGANTAVDRLEGYIPAADVLDIGQAAFEIFEDESEQFRWRLRHRNGNILADSGEGYADRTRAREGLESVKRNGPNADVVEE